MVLEGEWLATWHGTINTKAAEPALKGLSFAVWRGEMSLEPIQDPVQIIRGVGVPPLTGMS